MDTMKFMVDTRKVCGTLEAVAKNYPEASEEYIAINLAASALLFAWQEEVQARFQHYLDSMDRELTGDGGDHVKSTGILQGVP